MERESGFTRYSKPERMTSPELLQQEHWRFDFEVLRAGGHEEKSDDEMGESGADDAAGNGVGDDLSSQDFHRRRRRNSLSDIIGAVVRRGGNRES